MIPDEAVEAAWRRAWGSAAIVIDSGAGSLLPAAPDRDVEATRRGLAAIRATAGERRRKAQNKEEQ